MSYTTISGDTWDGIAKTVYGAERYADYLMQQNPTKINVFRFDAGVATHTSPTRMSLTVRLSFPVVTVMV